jgi:hypothetical protein
MRYLLIALALLVAPLAAQQATPPPKAPETTPAPEKPAPTLADLQSQIEARDRLIAAQRNTIKELRIQAMAAQSSARQLAEQVVNLQMQNEARQAQQQVARVSPSKPDAKTDPKPAPKPEPVPVEKAEGKPPKE